MKHIFQMMAFLCISIVLLGGCSSVSKSTSKWRSYDITVDGLDNEWQGMPQYYDEDNQISIKFLNDEEFLYLCIASGDRRLKRQLIMSGFTLWFDAEGGKKKSVGIRLPSQGFHRPPDISKGEQDRSRSKQDSLLDMPVELEIIYSNNDVPKTMDIAQARQSGIEFSTGQSTGRVVYEFKIKINESSILAVKPEAFLGIGLETGKMDKTEIIKKENPGGDNRPGGGGDNPGRGGGMKGKHGEGRGSHSRQMAKPFEVWLNVKMASKQ